MEQILNVLWYRRWIVFGILAVAIALSPFLSRLTLPKYVANAEVVVIGNGISNNGVLPIGDISALAMSTNVLAQTAKQMKYHGPLNDLRKDLSVGGAPSSNILTIQGTAKDPNFALAAANALADQIVTAYHRLASQQYNLVVVSLNKQLEQQRQLIDDLDHQLQTAAQTDIVAVSPNSIQAISDRLSQLDASRTQAQAAFVADQAAAGVQGSGDIGNDRRLHNVVTEQVLASDPYYQALRAGQAKDAAEYQFERASYTTEYPGLAGLKAKVSSEAAAVDLAASTSLEQHAGSSSTYANLVVQQRTAAAQVAGDKARLSSIDADIAQTQNQLRTLPVNGSSANQLRLQRDSAASAYGELNGRLQMMLADQQQAASLNSVIVLNYAPETMEKTPRIKLALMLTFIIVAIAVGAALLYDKIDRRLRTKEEIEGVYGRPLLGTLSR